MFSYCFHFRSNESSFTNGNLQTTSSTFNFESSEENKSDNYTGFENFKFPESLETNVNVSSEEKSTSVVLEHKEIDTKNYHFTSSTKKEPVGGNSVNSTPSSSTKKAKSLDLDDTLNVNTKIPENTEVWALASGLWAPNFDNSTRKTPQSLQSSYDVQTTDDYLNINQEASNSPESLLVKWSEVMKIMNNKTSSEKNGNQSKRVLNNELNEEDKVKKQVSSTPSFISTLNLDNNRIDLDNQEQRINETIALENKPKNQNYQLTSKTIDKSVEIFDATSETNKNLDSLRISEPESNLDITATTTETIETTTESDVSELSVESDGFTTEATTEDFLDHFTLLGEDETESENDDSMSKRTVPTEITTTEIPSSTPGPESIQTTTTEVNLSINEIPESTERYNKTSISTSTAKKITTELRSTAMPRSLDTTENPTLQSELSTTTSNVIEFKPMSSEPPKEPRLFQNDTEKYEYSTVVNHDLLPQSSSTAYTTELPPSTFSYYPKSTVGGRVVGSSTSTTDNSISQENTGESEPMSVTSIVVISICVACVVLLAFIAVFWVSVSQSFFLLCHFSIKIFGLLDIYEEKKKSFKQHSTMQTGQFGSIFVG